MIEIGRLIVKIAGRDAGQKGLIVDILEGNYVMIDGQVRRRKCNITHIEPLNKIIKIKKGDSHDNVVKALKAEGIEVKESKKKEKSVSEKPKKIKKSNKKTEESAEEKISPKKKAVKKKAEKK